MKWFIKCLKQYADFKGRARRKEYWWFTLINFIIMMILMVPLMAQLFKLGLSGADMSEYELYAFMFSSPFLWIIIVYYLAVLLPGIAVCIRRLHDIGRSGWWVLLIYGGSVLSTIGNIIKDDNLLAYAIIALVALIIGIIGLVWLFTDSQPGENQWGPNPKEPQVTVDDNQQ